MTKSFLKWAGGKSQSLDLLKPYINNKVMGILQPPKTFIEPFVGSGVVFMNTQADSYIINDINEDLVSIYETLKADGENFIDQLEEFFSGPVNTQEKYYELRDEFNALELNEDNKVKRAMLFIYLNRHCFNGLCRYNKSGGFNVPYGKYKKVHFPKESLKTAIDKLNKVTIFNTSFEEIMSLGKQGDVVYCLPEGSLVYQDGNYLPIEMVKINNTDLGNGNICTKKHVRYTKNEKLIKLNIMGVSRHYDLLLSENHVVFTYDTSTKMIVEKKASELTTEDRLIIDYEKKITNIIPEYKVYNKLNNKVLKIDYKKKNNLARLLGLYMAEGHMQNGVHLSYSIHEHRLHSLTKKLIKDVFDLDAKICPNSPHKTVTQVRCHSKELEQYILEFYNGKTARFKKLNDFVIYWDIDMQLNLLIGWLEGDGGLWSVTETGESPAFTRTGKRNKFKLTGTTASFELASQMYNIALRCGLHPCFKKRVSKLIKPATDGRYEITCYDVYFTMKKDVEILLNVEIDGRSCGRRFHTDDYLVTRINKITSERFTGNMYDLTTTEGNFWCMGNIKVHNCDPPYVPLSPTASFTDYAKTGFTMEDQRTLAMLAENSKAKVLISNHDNEITRELYKNADEIVTKEVSRFISANKESRKPAKELLAIYKKD